MRKRGHGSVGLEQEHVAGFRVHSEPLASLEAAS